MNEQDMNESAADATTGHERCLCYEVLDLFRSRLGISPKVKQHLANSRIEVLKAIRTVIDERIEHLSKPAQHGTKIQVE